jgi:23S rRNA G2445 N2-methylase RlmL
MNWFNLFSIKKTFSIITNVVNSNINNSMYAGQILKDVICDQFREKFKKRPDFKPKNGDFVLNMFINNNMATISLDITGISMHKRGYRAQGNVAPIQETIAAAIITLTESTGAKP